MIRNVRHILGLLLLCILLLPARAEAAVSSVEDLAGLLNAEQLQSARQLAGEGYQTSGRWILCL